MLTCGMRTYTKLLENRGQLCHAYVAGSALEHLAQGTRLMGKEFLPSLPCSGSVGVKDHSYIARRVICLPGSELNTGRTLLISVGAGWAHKGTFVGIICYSELWSLLLNTCGFIKSRVLSKRR